LQRKNLKEEQARCGALAAEKRRVETENRNLHAKIADGELDGADQHCTDVQAMTRNALLQSMSNMSHGGCYMLIHLRCTVSRIVECWLHEADAWCVPPVRRSEADGHARRQDRLPAGQPAWELLASSLVR